MTIILFLIDTSASMNQRTYLGTTLIDVAKSAVETFMKIRSRDPNSRWDRFMLLTFEDPPANVKAGWKESHATFMSELKNLQASGLSSLGPALKNSLDLLNLNRMQTGIDTYGQGRCPFYLEPAVIIVITDGDNLTSQNGVQPELNLPMNSVVPGSELTKEPFRWDQRIFSLVLKLPGSIPPDTSAFPFIPTVDNHPIEAMCDVTGGRSYAILNQKMMTAALDSLVQKVQSGVVINFEKFGPDPPLNDNGIKNEMNTDNNGSSKENQDVNKPVVQDKDVIEDKKPVQLSQTLAWHSCRRLIYVPRSAQKGYSVGHWPIPESFWPEVGNPTLPPRTAHPVVRFSCAPFDPMVIDNLPFDKYELEPSPLTQYILERRQPNTCWQVFVSSSAKYSEICHPFGYLKASSALTCVNMFVMPYNYPVLLPLLDELFKVHKLKPTIKWRQQFENYLKTLPGYYAGPLRRALARMGAPNLVPENMDNCLSYSVITYLKKLKNQAKIEMDRLVASVGQKVLPHEGIKVTSRLKTSILQRKDFNQLIQNLGSNVASLRQELQEFNTFTVAVSDPEIQPQYYRNPYDIPRESLLDQVTRMKMNFLQTKISNTKLVDEDQIHSIPVQQMGNYQEYLKKQPQPLRELENQPIRLHTFGNPFKVKQNMMIDEADEAMFGASSPKRRNTESPPSSPGPKKRKPGPLPRDIPIRRPSSPAPSPSPSISEDSSDDSPKTDSEDSIEERPLQIVLDGEEEQEEPTNSMFNGQKQTNHYMPENTLEQSNSLEETSKTDGQTVERKAISAKKQNQIWQHNTRLKHIVIKEVKKPGRNYENLFSQLNTVQGSLDIKRAFVQDTINEAARFKKRVLIKMLEQFEQSMIQNETKKARTGNTSPMPITR